MNKWIVISIVILMAGAGGWYYWKSRHSGSDQSEKPKYTEARVERMPLKQEVSCTGSVVSNLDVEIKCKATGQVVSLPYEISDPVEKGALLLKIDPVDEERTVRQAEVRLASSEAKLARAKQNLVVSELELEKSSKEIQATLKGAQASSKELRAKAERMSALKEKEYASPEEVDSAESAAVQGESSLTRASAGLDGIKVDEQRLELLRQDIKLAQADADSIQIDLENAKQRLKETQVFAPMAGVISARLVQVGQIIASPTMNVGGGTSLLTLSDLSRIFVLADVDESDVGLVQVKQKATIKVDGFPDEKFTGEVVRVATKGTKLSNVVTFEVKIEVMEEGKSKLRPLMTADVEILVAEKGDALAVPVEAIKRRGPEKVVLTPAAVPGAEPAALPVKTGMDDGAHIEILSGLEEGAAILIPDEQTDESAKKSGFMPPPPPPM